MKPFQPDGASLAKGPDGRSFSADGRVQKSIEQGAEFTKEKKPEDFLSYRKEGIARISRDVCQRFDNEGLSDEKISAYFQFNPPEYNEKRHEYYRTTYQNRITEAVRIVLKSFKKLENLQRTEEASVYPAARSLQLFMTARDHFGIFDPNILMTVLARDLHQTNYEKDRSERYKRTGRFESIVWSRDQMITEIPVVNPPPELSGQDVNKLSTIQLVKRLSDRNIGAFAVSAELLDRIDGMASWENSSGMLLEESDVAKIKQDVLERFCKDQYIVEQISRDRNRKNYTEDQIIQDLRKFFQALAEYRLAEFKKQFGFEITNNDIQKELDGYSALKARYFQERPYETVGQGLTPEDYQRTLYRESTVGDLFLLYQNGTLPLKHFGGSAHSSLPEGTLATFWFDRQMVFDRDSFKGLIKTDLKKWPSRPRYFGKGSMSFKPDGGLNTSGWPTPMSSLDEYYLGDVVPIDQCEIFQGSVAENLNYQNLDGDERKKQVEEFKRQLTEFTNDSTKVSQVKEFYGWLRQLPKIDREQLGDLDH